MNERMAQIVAVLAFLSVHALVIAAFVYRGPYWGMAYYYVFLVGICLQVARGDREKAAIINRAELARREAAEGVARATSSHTSGSD